MNYKVKDIPKDERPRERFLNVGVNNLSNQELLAIILKTGTKNNNVKEVALDECSKFLKKYHIQGNVFFHMQMGAGVQIEENVHNLAEKNTA